MRRRPLGKTDLQAPELCLGTALFGEATDEAEAVRERHFDWCLAYAEASERDCSLRAVIEVTF